MAISAAMVKELRERTGAGMMDCKRMLTETNGDMDAAIDLMRKSGAAKADKKATEILKLPIFFIFDIGNTCCPFTIQIVNVLTHIINVYLHIDKVRVCTLST